MIIYISMFFYVFLLGKLRRQRNERESFGPATNDYSRGITGLYAFSLWLLPVFFIGMRTEYNDTSSYIGSFYRVSSMSLSQIIQQSDPLKGIIWKIYIWLVGLFTDAPSVFLLLTAIIHGALISKAYRRFSPDYAYSVLLFFLSCAFTNMMGGIRQFTAVCIILVSFRKYIRGDRKSFLFWILVAATFHVSAIIWAPVVFFIDSPPFKRRMWLAVIATMVVLIFLNTFTRLLDSVLEDTAYDGYVNQFAKDDGSSVFHTIIALVPVAIAFIYRNQLYRSGNKTGYCLVNISVFAVLVSLVANFTSGVLIGRMPIYFTIFNYITLPWLFRNIVPARKERLFRTLCILGYMGYALFYLTRSWGIQGLPYISSVLGINTML